MRHKRTKRHAKRGKNEDRLVVKVEEKQLGTLEAEAAVAAVEEVETGNGAPMSSSVWTGHSKGGTKQDFDEDEAIYDHLQHDFPSRSCAEGETEISIPPLPPQPRARL